METLSAVVPAQDIPKSAVDALYTQRSAAEKQSSRTALTAPISVHDEHNAIKSKATTENNGRKLSQFEDDPWERKTVLSLDGGGVRGLCELYVLERLMSIIVELENNSGRYCSASYINEKQDDTMIAEMPGVKRLFTDKEFLPCHYFDYIGGTSTGGLIALMLGRLRHNVHTAIERCELIWSMTNPKPSRKLSWIRSSRKANTESMTKLLEGVIMRNGPSIKSASTELFLSDEDLSRTLVLATRVDKTPSQTAYEPYWLRSYSGYNDSNERLRHVKVWEAARATSAAPTYFSRLKLSDSAGDLEFSDGSRWSMNPAMELYREVSSMHDHETDRPIAMMLSIGTGGKRSDPIDDAVRRRLDNDSVYCRISTPDRTSNVRLDEWKLTMDGRKTFRSLRESVKGYCSRDEVDRQLKRCARYLVKKRVERSKTYLWQRRALGIQYDCVLCRDEIDGYRWVFQQIRPRKEHPKYESVANEKPVTTANSPATPETASSAQPGCLPEERHDLPYGHSNFAPESSLLDDTVVDSERSGGQVLSDTGLHHLHMVRTDSSYYSASPRRVSSPRRRRKRNHVFDEREDFIDHLQQDHGALAPDVDEAAREDLERLLVESARSTFW